LKGLTTGVAKQWEQSCQTAVALLQDSGGNKHKNDYISFILDSLAKPLCKDMCNFKNYIMIKGRNDRSARLLGT
jgi:hypothetical protein